MKIRLTENRLRDIIKESINESFRTYDSYEHNLIDKLYDLEIDYDYINSDDTMLKISIDNEEMRRLVNNLLNVYGWVKIMEDEYSICAERRYGDKMDNYIDPDEKQWGICYAVRKGFKDITSGVNT